jgi:hypothetical protein
MRRTVKDVSTLFPTAIITGRSREKVYICFMTQNSHSLKAVLNLFYAHNAENRDFSCVFFHDRSMNLCSCQSYTMLEAMEWTSWVRQVVAKVINPKGRKCRMIR